MRPIPTVSALGVLMLSVLAQGVLALSVLAAAPAQAQSADCGPLLGTYLTKKIDTSGVDKGIEGRTILSLAQDGFATMTDSAQGGIEGYQAFGMLQGVWTCEAGDGSGMKIRATLVDFSYPDGGNPGAKVARVEISGSVDPASGALKGKTAVNLFPLLDDPFSGRAPELVVDYEFEGRRILVTPPGEG